MSVQIETKAAVTVSEMARMLGMSRARFYQLQAAEIFPSPVYDVSTRRPIYVEEAQKLCLEVRRRNCGINGKPVLFYARRAGTMSVPKTRTKPTAMKKGQYAEIVEGVRALGLTSVTAAQVEAVVTVRYKCGTEGVDQGEVIRTVFLDLMRQNSGDSVR